MLQISPPFTEKSYNSDLKMSHLNTAQTESKPQKQNSSKNTSGSSLNANNNNGIYVDLGKLLLEAAKMGDSDKVQECIKNGAPFITDWLGTSALHVAAKNNYYETCATLLRSGISKDAKTKVDRTPLHFAVFEGNFEICQLLIQHECSVDPLDMLKMTPLHWAIEKNFDNIAELLLENGANPHIMSKFLKTPYLLAKEKNNDFIVNLIEGLPTTPLSANSSQFDSVFAKTPTPTTTKIKEESTSSLNDAILQHRASQKRERFHSYDSADSKRLKTPQNDAKNLTLQLLKEQMSMMSSSEDSLIQSALQSGRKLILSEAGKKLLNDSTLNKFLKIPLHTTISSSSSTKTMRGRSTSGGDTSDALEIFRESKQKATNNNADILNIIRTTNDLQEVTITQRSSKLSSLVQQQQNSGVSLSAINVPKAKAQNLTKSKTLSNHHHQLPSTTTTTTVNNSTDFRNNNSTSHIQPSDDFSKPDVVKRKYSELLNSHQQLRRSFEREQQKNDVLQRQLSKLQSEFDTYKRQQQSKIDSVLQLLLQFNNSSGDRNNVFKFNNADDDETEEIL